jgi:hypothetical protein
MQLKNRFILSAFALLVVLGIASSGIILAQTPLMIPLTEQNSSGENGTATFTDLGNGMVRVEVAVTGAPAGASQPMHLHEGTCATLNPAPAFPLNNLENGTSTTEISATLEALLASPYALNGHKSAAEASVYVFCGDLVEAVAQETVTGTVAAETPTVAATEQVTATTEATTEATTAATAEATAEATTAAAETPAPTETPTTTLPGTGADSPLNALVPVLILGIVMLALGLYVRRAFNG